MTPQEALKNLEQAVRQIQANAEVHDVLRECIKTIALALQPKESTPPTKKEVQSK